MDAYLPCTRVVDSTGLSLCPGRLFLFSYTYLYARCRCERLGGGGGPPSSAPSRKVFTCRQCLCLQAQAERLAMQAMQAEGMKIGPRQDSFSSGPACPCLMERAEAHLLQRGWRP